MLEVGIANLLDSVQPLVRLPQREVGAELQQVGNRPRDLRIAPCKRLDLIRRRLAPAPGVVLLHQLLPRGDRQAIRRRTRKVNGVPPGEFARPPSDRLREIVEDALHRGKRRTHLGERHVRARIDRLGLVADQVATVGVAPARRGGNRQHLAPDPLEATDRIVTEIGIAVAAERRQQRLGRLFTVRPPGVFGEVAQRERIGMGRLRPQNVALAHRIVLNLLLPLFDERIVGAHVEAGLVAKEDAERIRHLALQAPLREVVGHRAAVNQVPVALRRIGLVVPDDDLRRIKMTEQRLHLVRAPGEVEVPAREQHLGRGMLLAGLANERVHHVDLELQVVRPVGVDHPLAETDCVQEVRLAVARVQKRLGETPVAVEIAGLADIPDASRVLAIALRRLRQELGLHLVEIGARRARIPVGHRPEVNGHHYPALLGVGSEGLAEPAAVFEGPEERAIVEALPRLGQFLRGIGIRHDVGIRLLPRVVHADAGHHQVQAVLDAPVNLALPVLESPMLGLKARQASMREVAEPAILELRLLADVESGAVDLLLPRHNVAVPEPLAAAAAGKEVVDGEQHRTLVRANEADSLPFAHDAILVVERVQLRVDGKRRLRRFAAGNLSAIAVKLRLRDVNRTRHDLKRRGNQHTT